MGHDFDRLMEDIEREARRGGPKATAQYAAFGAYHRLARQIFDLRRAAGLTHRQLAAKSGVRQAEIGRIEAGDANPTLATIAALAYALGAEFALKPSRPPRRQHNPLQKQPSGAGKRGQSEQDEDPIGHRDTAG